MNNFKTAFFTNDYYVYYQLLITCILLAVIMLISLFSKTIVISYGAYMFVGCLIINFLLSLFTDNYRYFILHWFLSSISFFTFWCVLIYICGRYGKPYNGDSGIILLLPGYFLPLLIFISVVIKLVKMVIQRF
ncbi:hypothetical protein CLU83_1912 [Flavobacterium sp. 1]|nr:hypothetical protein CLU83_1912 [Flavobacterium sp. 1]